MANYSKQHSAKASASHGDPVKTANIVSMADLESKSTKWFWQGYVPAAAISVLHGDPDEGKSTISLDLIARFSRGDSMPGSATSSNRPGNSLLVQCEDDLERTTLPRLEAAGAVINRVHTLRTVTIDDETRPLQLPVDLDVVEQKIWDLNIGLIVVDVLSGFVQDGISINDDAAMRRLANEMACVAERTQAAFLLLGHFNKKEDLRSMYRAGGSIAIIGAARAAFAVAQHPEDPAHKVFMAVKSNLGPRPKSLTYSIEEHEGTSRIRWGDASELTASDVLSRRRDRAGTKVDAAQNIIVDILRDGPRGENEVRTACSEAGVSERTYKRARKLLGIVSEKSEFHGEWLLSLPSTNGYAHEDW